MTESLSTQSFSHNTKGQLTTYQKIGILLLRAGIIKSRDQTNIRKNKSILIVQSVIQIK